MPPSRHVPTPTSFVLLGMVLAVVAFGTGAFVLYDSLGPVGRILLATITVLSLVVVEALWWVRAWVARAVDVWAAVCTVTVFAVCLVGTGFELAMLVLPVVGLPCAGIRWYVRDRAHRLGLSP